MTPSAAANPKAVGWDAIGARFWTLGRISARPNAAEIAAFTEGITPADRVAVVGASTKELVDALIACGTRPTVLDFSAGMCEALREAVGDAADIGQVDVVAELPAHLVHEFDAVLCDRLINRFTGPEARAGMRNVLRMLREGGTLRTTVKVGLYPMDRRMIEAGRVRGTLDRFYDAPTRTIDFSAAGDILDDCLLPHGSIPRDLLLSWYRSRGAEKRFTAAECTELVTAAARSLAAVVGHLTVVALPNEAGVVFVHGRLCRAGS